MIAAFFVLLIIGIPVAISIAVTAFVFGYLGFGPMLFNLLPSRIYGVVTNYTFMAIPLFVFMGVMLEKSKLAEELIGLTNTSKVEAVKIALKHEIAKHRRNLLIRGRLAKSLAMARDAGPFQPGAHKAETDEMWSED